MGALAGQCCQRKTKHVAVVVFRDNLAKAFPWGTQNFKYMYAGRITFMMIPKKNRLFTLLSECISQRAVRTQLLLEGVGVCTSFSKETRSYSYL